MSYKDTIDIILNYIDENIKDNLSVEKMSEKACFSPSSFFRLFLLRMDMTPMKYVLRRKLYFAAKELICSKMKIVDIAFEYGFESHDVFIRAFKRYYGISPGIFRKNASNLDEFYRDNNYCISDFAIPILNNQKKDENIMSEQKEHEVKIVTLPETILIGIERIIDGNGCAFEAFYEAYDRVFRNAKNRKCPNSTNATHALSELMPDGSYMYFIGIEVTSLDDIPDGAIGKILPPQLCAVIGYEGGIDYRETTDYFYKIWFDKNTYKTGHMPDYPYCTVEYYAPNNDCDVYDERIYVPIKEMDYEIVEIPEYCGLYCRAICDSCGKAKDEAFDTILKWMSENNLFGNGEVKLEVFYGNAEDDKVFCEIFYRADNPSQYKTNEKIKIKSYPKSKCFHSSSIHHFLEPNSRAIIRYVKQNTNFSFADSGSPDYRPYFEEYRLKSAKLDMYTPLDLFIYVEENE